MVELIITEKPNAAKKIAEALADGKAIKENEKGVPYYRVTHGKNDILVGCAVGHIYGLKSIQKGFPVFDVSWVPSYEVTRGTDYSKKYVMALRKLAKLADTFTVATDFDIEGEVIGLNVIRYIAKQKDANRMKFSTLTKDELVKAYEEKQNHLDWGQANAGETRHILDWYYGINISRALTKSIQKAGMFKLLSTGRVQGPALNLVVEREKEIRAFKAEPYWELELTGAVKSGKLIALHEKGKFEKEEEALSILAKTKDAPAHIAQLESKTFKQNPPNPFDLTSLQMEAHGKLRIAPKQTLSMAQELYTAGFISYPRTSSQEYPESIGYKKILTGLAKQNHLKDAATELLAKKKLTPNNGKKTDPAHPAIYPTGESPHGLKEKEAKLYELICRRFLATFGEPATKETATYTIECNKEKFITKGTVTKEPGWITYYGPFNKVKEEELPKTEKGEEITKKKVTKLDKETLPPKRYTEASIIKALEKQGLGTKATRASIVDTLFNRNYIEGKQIKVTDLGMQVEEILQKYCSLITDQAMTRHFEEEMEKIRDQKAKPEDVLAEARKVIIKIIHDFKDKEGKVGEGLKETFQETRDKQETLGPCPKCKEGVVKVRRGKFGKFAACDKYPECKTTYSLPNNGLIEPLEENNICLDCGAPRARIIRAGKRPMEVCISPDCPTKQVEVKGEGQTCEKCKKGKMMVRRSVYGSFLGCDGYPKCKNIIQIKKAPSEEQESEEDA